MKKTQETDPGYNPWKVAMISLGVSLVVLVTAGLVVAAIFDKPEESALKISAEEAAGSGIPAGESPAGASSSAAEPSPRRTARPMTDNAPPATVQQSTTPYRTPPRENCSRYLADSNKDSGKVLRDGLAGGALGAGLGAAGGAIADGGDGAGKGAAIGGLIGAVAGALNRNTKENAKSRSARQAYEDCLARNDGY